MPAIRTTTSPAPRRNPPRTAHRFRNKTAAPAPAAPTAAASDDIQYRIVMETIDHHDNDEIVSTTEAVKRNTKQVWYWRRKDEPIDTPDRTVLLWGVEHSADLSNLRVWLKKEFFDDDGKLNSMGFEALAYYCCPKMSRRDFDYCKENGIKVIPPNHPMRRHGVNHRGCCTICEDYFEADRDTRHAGTREHIERLADCLGMELDEFLVPWWMCPNAENCGNMGSYRKDSPWRHMRLKPHCRRLNQDLVGVSILASEAVEIQVINRRKALGKQVPKRTKRGGDKPIAGPSRQVSLPQHDTPVHDPAASIPCPAITIPTFPPGFQASPRRFDTSFVDAGPSQLSPWYEPIVPTQTAGPSSLPAPSFPFHVPEQSAAYPAASSSLHHLPSPAAYPFAPASVIPQEFAEPRLPSALDAPFYFSAAQLPEQSLSHAGPLAGHVLEAEVAPLFAPPEAPFPGPPLVGDAPPALPAHQLPEGQAWDLSGVISGEVASGAAFQPAEEHLPFMQGAPLEGSPGELPLGFDAWLTWVCSLDADAFVRVLLPCTAPEGVDVERVWDSADGPIYY